MEQLTEADVFDDGQGFIDLLFEEGVMPLQKISYFTLQLHSTESLKVYCFDVSLGQMILDPLLITQNLLDRGILSSGERFRVELRVTPGARQTPTPCAAS